MKFAKGGIISPEENPLFGDDCVETIIPHGKPKIEGLADIVQVVRCKDCKHCRTASWGEKYCSRKQVDGVYSELSNLSDDDFCSYGERKDAE